MSTRQDVFAFVSFLDEVFVTRKSAVLERSDVANPEEAGSIAEVGHGSGAICVPPAYSFG